MALFVALGGTALAANTVGSGDVIDDSLKSQDLKDGAAVQASDVVGDSITGAGINAGTLTDVPNTDLLQGNYTSADLAKTDSEVGGDVSGRFSNMQLRDDVITAGVVRNYTLKREDLSADGGGAYGRVSSGGILSHSSNVSSVTHPSEGVYCIKAKDGIDPADRALMATPDFADDTTVEDNVNGGENGTLLEWSSAAPSCAAGKFEVLAFKQNLVSNDEVYNTAFHDEAFAFVIR